MNICFGVQFVQPSIPACVTPFCHFGNAQICFAIVKVENIVGLFCSNCVGLSK